MDSVIAFLQGHGLPTLLAVFTFVSVVLSGVASLFQGLGKVVPGFIGTASDILGKVLHFLNGNVAAAVKSKEPSA